MFDSSGSRKAYDVFKTLRFDKTMASKEFKVIPKNINHLLGNPRRA